MSEKNDTLVQVDHLKKYFPVKGVKRTWRTGGGRYFYLYQQRRNLGLVGESVVVDDFWSYRIQPA